MDTGKLIELLRGTLDPNVRLQAEEELSNIQKIIGFVPSLFPIVMMNEMDLPIRQAGVIYLKNMITQYWRDGESKEGDEPFHIHEQDRAVIRGSMVDAMVHAPEMIRVQLSVCVYQMIKNDFPSRWPEIIPKINMYLQNPDRNCWQGALTCLYQLIKNYEYKKKEIRVPLDDAMKVLLPLIYERITHLVQDQSDHSALLQKIILKIFFALTQYTLSLNLIPKEVFTQWIEIISQIVNREVPKETDHVDEDQKPELSWWKVKKWALHILVRIFERYGCPTTCMSEYTSFAKWYTEVFARGTLQITLKLLDNYTNKIFVSPRVLQLSINYIEQGVGYSVTWKFLKPHSITIAQNVIFPMLCYSNADEELWNTDPIEFVRVKADIYEDLVSPVTAAQSLLRTMVKKRKEMLDKTMAFLMQVLSTPNLEPRHKDGVFHMIGTLGAVLLRKPLYKDQMERMIVQYIFPEFSSPHGFMRARACWILQQFDEIKYQDDNLVAAANFLQNALLNDVDLPVKVEAAMAMSELLAAQDKAEPILEPNMTPIVQQLLGIIKDTENEELTNVLCKLVSVYAEQLTPIAAEMCSQLATTFQQVIECDDGPDEKAITAMGLLGTIEALLNCMDENADLMSNLEPIVLQVIALILTKNVMEFYEEAFSLVYNLTSTRVSNDLWKCYEMMYNIFKEDGFEYFTEMMPAFHNYLCIDTSGFLSSEARVHSLLDICKTILTADIAEDEQSHAAKLLEVMVLQCRTECVPYFTTIIQMVVERLITEIKTTELRTMLLQVIIGALYTSPQVVLPTLQGTIIPNSDIPLSNHFIKQWLHDVDCFFGLHDRKLCVLGFCTLLQLGPERLPVLRDLEKEILPALVLLFKGLKSAYAAKAILEDSDDEDNEEEDSELDESEVLDSDEDETTEGGEEYLARLAEKVTNASNSPFEITASIQDDASQNSEGDDLDDLDETTLESFMTPLDKDDCDIDEYWAFKTVMQNLERSVPEWYNTLVGSLDEESKKIMLEVSTLADQRLAARQSKKIEESGGFNFSDTTIPSSFNFGGAFGS